MALAPLAASQGIPRPRAHPLRPRPPHVSHTCLRQNSVDTGWVTDMAPGGVGVAASRHATFVAPPLDEEDGAARVLDPIFVHLQDATWLVRGRCFRNYFVAGW